LLPAIALSLQDLSKFSFPKLLYSTDIHSSCENQSQSPLLRLPGELRNIIYRYFLGNVDIRMFYVKGHWPQHTLRYRRTGNSDPRWFKVTARVIALLSVCRQIHAETRCFVFILSEISGQSK